MKKYFIALLIIVCLDSALFAGTSVMDSSKPTEASNASVDVAFTFDPKTMFRTTLGFTEETVLNWDSLDDDLEGKSFYLTTEQKPGHSDYFRGVGSVNFYWKLRTPHGLRTSIYLASPLIDQNDNQLDFKIEYRSNIKGNQSAYILSSYGEANARPLFEKEADPEMKVAIDYIPIKISTDYIKIGSGDKVYSSNIGVLVQVV